MTRFVLALALLGGIVGLAKADYLLIIANMGVSKNDTGPAAPGYPGMPGAGYPGGGPGGAGDTGGAPGMMPPGMMPPGMMPPGGSSGGAPPGMAPPGMMPPGGSSGGAPPGMMPPGMMPPGSSGGMPPGMMPPGMMPPGGYPGMPGYPGMAGAAGDPRFTPLLAIAVVEIGKSTRTPILPGLAITKVQHKWGESYVLPQTSDKRIIVIPFKTPTVHHRFETQSKAAHKDGKPTPESLLELAEWSLRHSLRKEFEATMEELAGLAKDHTAVLAYRKVKADMDRPITKPDNSAPLLQGVLENYKSLPGEHYVLLHNLSVPDAPEAKSRLARLEDTYRLFFYWFALKGKPLPVPTERLLAVLVVRQDEFTRQQQIFDSEPPVADGFLARRENLAVFSLERIDPASVALRKSTEDIWRKIDRDGALKKFPAMLKAEPLKGAEVQTYALLQKALEEDSEIASVSHEGTRQLLAATGLLPRNVAVPQWVAFGVASFFETPKGSPWRTLGTPSATPLPEFNYLAQYKAMDKAKKLEKDRLTALQNTVADQYFREAAAKDKEKDKDKAQEALVKARTMAWSLVYFLANKKADGLRRYHEELARLPRDLEFDRDVLLQVFARSFDLLDPKRTDTIDQGKLANLANQWHDFISLTPLSGEEILKELVKNQTELRADPAKPGAGVPPGRPATPGGGNPGGGGGIQ